MLRQCRKCGVEYPLNKDNFGHQPNGSYRYTCRACVSANVRRHYREHPYQVHDRAELRRDSVLTVSERTSYTHKLATRDGWGCYYCKQRFNDYHIDHKLPMTRGGTHTLDNFVLACMQCNQEKHSKTVDEYRTWLRRRGEKINF